MIPGEIYKVFFQFAPPVQGGKYRPALIMQVDNGQAIAVAVKITKSGPNPRFPNRLFINNWIYAGLDYPSYVEIPSATPIPTTIPITKKVGTLHPIDFSKILSVYRNHFNV